MKRIALSTAAVVALIGSAGLANAYEYNRYGTNTPRIDATQSKQAHEIEAARRKGQLTWREYFGLKREQAAIEQMEARAKRDGVVTWRERAEIRQAQQEAEKHIYKESHDAERQAPRYHRWWWSR